jgi:hypothetical protein
MSVIGSAQPQPNNRNQNKVMKQLLRNLIRFQTSSRPTVITAIAVAIALIFSPHAQADPGRGAVVFHYDPDSTGWWSAVFPDGQFRLEIFLFGPGDFIRENPDGTLFVKENSTQAPMMLSVLGEDGNWVETFLGIGSFHASGSVERIDGGSQTTGESLSFHVQGQFTNVFDGSPWSLHVLGAIRDWQLKAYKFDLRPR